MISTARSNKPPLDPLHLEDVDIGSATGGREAGEASGRVRPGEAQRAGQDSLQGLGGRGTDSPYAVGDRIAAHVTRRTAGRVRDRLGVVCRRKLFCFCGGRVNRPPYPIDPSQWRVCARRRDASPGAAVPRPPPAPPCLAGRSPWIPRLRRPPPRCRHVPTVGPQRRTAVAAASHSATAPPPPASAAVDRSAHQNARRHWDPDRMNPASRRCVQSAIRSGSSTTGSSASPRNAGKGTVSQRTSCGGRASVISGYRRNSVVSAMCISRRASGAPMQ